ncbi:hypothetical protein LNP74_05140 [Klebsiella pneumoniae subsp. pneumoniae]|nr:hypothetical protein [Klebsiella pneumoniae subsp. pneumoniae]
MRCMAPAGLPSNFLQVLHRAAVPRELALGMDKGPRWIKPPATVRAPRLIPVSKANQQPETSPAI